jgi:PKD repeat protein
MWYLFIGCIMHIITPYDPWSPKKKKTWREELWEQNQIVEVEARMLAEANSRTLPPNSPPTSLATVGPAAGAAAGAGGAPVVHWFASQNAANVTSINFTIAPSYTGTAPFAAQFVNLSSPDALNFWTWNWNFGDGTTDSARDPLHTFAQTGSYSVSLTGSSPNGTVVTQSIRLSYASASRPDMPITVAFSPTQTTGSVPFTVDFINQTANFSSTDVNTYKWIFSGSTTPVTPVTTSAVANPSIVFYNRGNYSIKLETTGSWNVTGSAYYQLAISASS